MDDKMTDGILDNVHICLGVPTYDGTAEAMALIRAQTQASKTIRFTPIVEGSSSLPHVFNRLWVQSLAGYGNPYTHFAMLHTDVVPDAWWLDTLYQEMQATGATVISAVSAIKDAKGVTSTALGVPEDEWMYRRVTVTEMQHLPETFDIDQFAASGVWPAMHTQGKCLLVNTGCMLIDLSWSHWLDKELDGITLSFRFNQDYRVQVWPNGRWNPEFAPEDWLMSRYVHKRGGKVVATKKVGTFHMGKQAYPSHAVWGNSTDVEVDAHMVARQKAFTAPAAEGVLG